MLYELALLACLADRPNSAETCRALYAPLGNEAYCNEQKELAMAALRAEGCRVFAVCAPTQVKEVRR